MSCLKVELIDHLLCLTGLHREPENKKKNMNLHFYLQPFTIVTKMKVKCKVTNQFTDEIFNLAKRDAEKTNVDS